MGSLPSDFAISLKARPSSKTNANLPSLIERINIERGGFQTITEESLRQEIAEAESDNEDGDEDDTSDEEEEELDRMKELMTSREEMLGQIEYTSPSPTGRSAPNRISEQLINQQCLLWTLFLSFYPKIPLCRPASRSRQPFASWLEWAPWVRTNYMLPGLQMLRNKIISRFPRVGSLKVSTRRWTRSWPLLRDLRRRLSLRRNIGSKFWLSAKADGRSVGFQMRSIHWELGLDFQRVRCLTSMLRSPFLTSTASPAFKNRSLAALRRNPDGTISLDQGIVSSEPQILRVRIQTGNKQTGSSAVPQPAAEDAPIEALILQARNTIFAEELWQELNREARSLGSYGVQSKDDTLVCPLSAMKTAVFDLVPLGEASLTGPDDSMAEGVFISLNLLLSYAHRQNHRRRTQPPPPISSQKKIIQPYNLLRFLLTRLKHQETIGQLNHLLGSLCRVIELAQVKPLPSFKVTFTPWTPPSQISQAERTMLSLIDRLEGIATFSITETTTITIAARTSIFPIGSTFYLSLPPDSPLMSICPPHPVLTSYSALRDYIHYFTACTIATSISSVGDSGIDDINDGGKAAWHQTPHPTTLRTLLAPSLTGSKLPRTKQLSLSIQPLSTECKTGVRLRAHWEWNGPEQPEHGSSGRRASFEATPLQKEDIRKALEKEKKDQEENEEEEITNLQRAKGKGEGVYDWVTWETEDGKGWDDGEGEVFRSLESVVIDAGK